MSRKPKVKIEERLWGTLQLTRDRIGKDPAQCLAWVIRFSQMDLAVLRPEERVALGKDLALFPVVMGYQSATFRSDLGPIPEATFTAVHGELGRGFRELMDGKAWAVPGQKQLYILRDSPEGSAHTRFRTYWDTRENIGDAILTTAARLLLEHGQKVRACPECRKVFVATRRQRYCDTRCSQRVRNQKRKEAEAPR